MKKTISAILALMMTAAMAMTGCSSASTGSSAAPESSTPVSSEAVSSQAEESTPSLSGKLTLTGSTSMNEVCNALGEEFKSLYPEVQFNKGGNGSGEGPTAVTDGTAQIGDLSRNVKDEENPDSFDVFQIAIDGIAVIVNPENPVADLTKEQIAQIYTGEVTNWKDLGGNDGTISVIGRDAQSGTRDGFESIFGIKEKCVYAAELGATGDVVTNVASDPNAIGYISLGSVNDSIKALKVGGVEATDENIVNGTYVVSRPFVQICKKGASESDSLIKAWFDFVYSEEGKAIIEECKLIPVDKP